MEKPIFHVQHKRRILYVFLVGGSFVFAGGRLLRKKIKAFQSEQKSLCESSHNLALSTSARPKIAVDAIFARRLLEILKICVPSIWSKEAFQVAIQTCLLYSRTLLTERIALVEGKAGQGVVSKDWSDFSSNLVNFACAAIPAAIVNSGLKYMQAIISLSLQQRLTQHLHTFYLSNRVYYAASVLGGLSNPDQRITEDIAKFSSSISELYSYTFKPVLDIIFFTRSLAKTIGYKGQFLLYGYFLFCSVFLRAISPPLALMTTQEAALSGNFRNAHQRIVSHAEEIAFNDPPGGDTERIILNDHLHKLIHHSFLSAIQRFLQQVADGYLVKYTASIVGLSVFAAPFYFSNERDNLLSTGEYIRAMRLMMNTSKAIGQLVLIYKRVTSLAAFTSRVSEILESVKQLSIGHEMNARDPVKRSLLSSTKHYFTHTPPTIIDSDIIAFENVTVYTPDGMLLVRELSFEVVPGHSVIVMGPNGSGKSSLFRVLAELWPLQSGIIQRPPRQNVFYLSQKPYVIQGTLRDQVRYPAVPGRLSTDNQISLDSTLHSSTSNDEQVVEALNATDLGYLAHRGDGLDQIQNWEETLSGGEKQRLAVSRLLYNNPRFAILDECTSAVSADGEEKLYRQLYMRGITMLSIAHRPALKRYHKVVLHVGDGQSSGAWRLENLEHGDALQVQSS